MSSNPSTSATITATRYNDYHPVANGNYFAAADCGIGEGLSVVVPFYNEEASAVQITLQSLLQAYTYAGALLPQWKSLDRLHVVLIADGWYKTSDSMKKYLEQLFASQLHWWEEPEFQRYDVHEDGSVTFVIESDKPLSVYPTATATASCCNVTLIVKMDNRKKHNSHEWFIGAGGFAEAMCSKYLLCTDAFTIFNKSCLYHLLKYMDDNPSTSVVTGRQRVMTQQQQQTDEACFSLGTMLRHVQLFDFEASNIVYLGAFSLAGFLPVVPGPCGLYRAKDMLNDDVRNWYFDIVNKNPSSSGQLLGNLCIAEDRILSYSAVLKTVRNCRMAFVPLSIFYFEAETSIRQLLLQRRRWFNGSFAGYIYMLLVAPTHLFYWNTTLLRKLYVSVLLTGQLITYGLVTLSTSFSVTIFYYSLDYLLTFTDLYNHQRHTISILATLAVWLLFAVHVGVHYSKPYYGPVVYALVAYSIVTATISAVALIVYVVREVDMSDAGEYSVIVYIMMLVFSLPFLLSLLLSGRGHSCKYMLKALPSYYLFSHMLISGFSSYALARTWDLSWGNRPSPQACDFVQRSMRRFKHNSLLMLLVVAVLNVAVFFLPLDIQLYILAAFFLIATFQLVMSTLYLLLQLPRKLAFCRLTLSHKNTRNKVDEMYTDSALVDL